MFSNSRIRHCNNEGSALCGVSSISRSLVIARLADEDVAKKDLLTASRSKLNTTAQYKNQVTKSNLDFMKQMGGWVYIMCSNNHSTLYVGVTSNIASRVYEHKHKLYPTSFSATYNCVKLVYYRRFELIIEAIAEEKRIKGGSRKKKGELINGINPEWKDLYDEIKYL